MTKKTAEGTSLELTELRALMAEMQASFATTIQISMQTSIQQLGESLTTRLDTMNAILTRLDPQNQQVANIQAPPPQNQQIPPPSQQQQLPPVHPPPRQHQHRIQRPHQRQHQFGDRRVHELTEE